jgi:hypothetical protein
MIAGFWSPVSDDPRDLRVVSHRPVSVAGDKDNSLIFVAASGTRAWNWCPGICSRARENPILTACEPTLPTFVVTAICIFGHRSQEMRFEERQIRQQVGRDEREPGASGSRARQSARKALNWRRFYAARSKGSSAV